MPPTLQISDLTIDDVSSQVTGVAPEGESAGEFGANEWLVDEMYERWLVDKNSVDPSWWPFLEQYRPGADAPTARPGRRMPPAAQAPLRSRHRRVERAAHDHRQHPRRAHHLDPARSQPIPADAPAPARSPPPRRPRPSPRSSRCKGVAKAIAANMDASLTRAHRDERAHHPGEAHDRQPDRDQQPPQARPRRQGVVHAPHRLGDGAGAQGLPEPERLLRRGRRQAVRRHPRAHQPRDRDRPARRTTARAPSSFPASSAPTPWRFAEFLAAYEDVVVPRPRQQAHDGRLRRATRSRSPTRAASAPSTRSRAS